MSRGDPEYRHWLHYDTNSKSQVLHPTGLSEWLDGNHEPISAMAICVPSSAMPDGAVASLGRLKRRFVARVRLSAWKSEARELKTGIESRQTLLDNTRVRVP